MVETLNSLADTCFYICAGVIFSIGLSIPWRILDKTAPPIITTICLNALNSLADT